MSTLKRKDEENRYIGVNIVAVVSQNSMLPAVFTSNIKFFGKVDERKQLSS